jgi:hypothetical protein
VAPPSEESDVVRETRVFGEREVAMPLEVPMAAEGGWCLDLRRKR